MISLTTTPKIFRHAVMSEKGKSRHHLLQCTQFSLCRWDPTCFQRTFSLSSSALWPEGSHYTQLASRRFLLLNAWLMYLTNSSSQATSTIPVCLRVMAYVTSRQILNKVCLSQLVIMLVGESQRSIWSYCDWRALGILGFLPQLILVHILKGAALFLYYMEQLVISVLHGTMVAPHSKG